MSSFIKFSVEARLKFGCRLQESSNCLKLDPQFVSWHTTCHRVPAPALATPLPTPPQASSCAARHRCLSTSWFSPTATTACRHTCLSLQPPSTAPRVRQVPHTEFSFSSSPLPSSLNRKEPHAALHVAPLLRRRRLLSSYATASSASVTVGAARPICGRAVHQQHPRRPLQGHAEDRGAPSALSPTPHIYIYRPRMPILLYLTNCVWLSTRRRNALHTKTQCA